MKSKLSKLEKSLKPSHEKAWESFYQDFYAKLPTVMKDFHGSWCIYHLKDEWSKQMDSYGVILLRHCGVDVETFEQYMTDNVHLLEQLDNLHSNLHIVPSELPDAPQNIAALEPHLNKLEGLFTRHIAQAYCVLLIYEFYAWSIAAQEAKEAKKGGVLA